MPTSIHKPLVQDRLLTLLANHPTAPTEAEAIADLMAELQEMATWDEDQWLAVTSHRMHMTVVKDVREQFRTMAETAKALMISIKGLEYRMSMEKCTCFTKLMNPEPAAPAAADTSGSTT